MFTKRILFYLAVSYGFSWFFWGRLALAHHFHPGGPVSPWNHFLAGLGPLVGALLTTLVFDRGAGLHRYFSEKLFTLPPLKWLAVGIGMPVVFFLVPFLFFGLARGEWVSFHAIGQNSKVPLSDPLLIWLLWGLLYGLGEEGGWRGFLFPELCKKYRARTATLYTAFVWAPWHLPLFFYDKDFQAMGLFGAGGWLVGLIFGSLLMGWLVKQANWNLWPVILWHGTFNWFTTSDAIDPLYPAIMSALVIATAFWVARRYGEDLTREVTPEP
jgi:membrane protease YdiL (CAAX protease family)